MDALSLEIFILQNNDDSIQVLHVPGGQFSKKIYLKFTHNNKYTTANHYILPIKNRKCSWEMAQLAICMDVNGPEDGLPKENAFFDVTHTRVHGFKSFSLLLVHGPMWEMIWLASMEMHSENSNDIAIF